MYDTANQRPSGDQAARLRQLVADRSPVDPGIGAPADPQRGHAVAVVSGKGGVGKTNVAVNLAICLAARGLKVTLVDLDMGLANADLLLDARSPYNISHVVSGLLPIDRVGVSSSGDIFFVPGASGVERLVDLPDFDRRHLINQVAHLATGCDVLVMDCAAGISPNVLCFAALADTCLLVTTPEPTAVADAYAFAKVSIGNGHQGLIRLLVNSADSREEAREVFTRIAGVAQRFLNYTIADAGYLLHDSHVELAVRQRCPFVLRYPRCSASACMTAIAKLVVGGRRADCRRGGLFRRVVGLFV